MNIYNKVKDQIKLDKYCPDFRKHDIHIVSSEIEVIKTDNSEIIVLRVPYEVYLKKGYDPVACETLTEDDFEDCGNGVKYLIVNAREYELFCDSCLPVMNINETNRRGLSC